jgi:hypothetical protein
MSIASSDPQRRAVSILIALRTASDSLPHLQRLGSFCETHYSQTYTSIAQQIANGKMGTY